MRPRSASSSKHDGQRDNPARWSALVPIWDVHCLGDGGPAAISKHLAEPTMHTLLPIVIVLCAAQSRVVQPRHFHGADATCARRAWGCSPYDPRGNSKAFPVGREKHLTSCATRLPSIRPTHCRVVEEAGLEESRARGCGSCALVATPPAVWAQDGRGRFNGTWRVEFAGNPRCYASYETARWTIRNGTVVTGRGTGTVNANGRVDIRYAGASFGHMNVIVARLKGNQGTGNVEVEGTQCRWVITLNRISN
jgi:hypothetical protein